jgi:hypothetical protein
MWSRGLGKYQSFWKVSKFMARLIIFIGAALLLAFAVFLGYLSISDAHVESVRVEKSVPNDRVGF